MCASCRACWKTTLAPVCLLPTFRLSVAERRSNISRATMARSMSTRAVAISVKDALVGINQLIDEDANKTAEPPPVIAEPISRQFLRIFDGKTELARDQIQKLLRGSGIAPDEFDEPGVVQRGQEGVPFCRSAGLCPRLAGQAPAPSDG